MYLGQCEGTMPITSVYKQVKELSHKLEQVAKQRQMEEEIAELKKHQAKIVELKQRVGKLTTKCQLWYAQTREDKVHVQHTLRVAALILELADRLTAQEEQARQTSTEVQQQISASFQPLPTNITKSKVTNDSSYTFCATLCVRLHSKLSRLGIGPFLIMHSTQIHDV
jgi:vacuolar-type H+-ATPase subunit I/STV1